MKHFKPILLQMVLPIIFLAGLTGTIDNWEGQYIMISISSISSNHTMINIFKERETF